MDHIKVLLLKVHKTNFTLIATAVNLEAKYMKYTTELELQLIPDVQKYIQHLNNYLCMGNRINPT
jgi:ribonucleotide reductase beta subunit family protein with ferritin-like domain